MSTSNGTREKHETNAKKDDFGSAVAVALRNEGANTHHRHHRVKQTEKTLSLQKLQIQMTFCFGANNKPHHSGLTQLYAKQPDTAFCLLASV